MNHPAEKLPGDMLGKTSVIVFCHCLGEICSVAIDYFLVPVEGIFFPAAEITGSVVIFIDIDKSKVTKLIVKTKLLKKKTVKGSLKGSKVKTIQVKVGSKKVNKSFATKYKKLFTKKNAGKKVTIK